MLFFLDKIPYGTPRIRRITFWLTLAFVLYTMVGFLAVPPIVKHVLTTQLTENRNRPARVEKVSFNPLLLDLKITGLTVDKLKGEGAFFSVGLLDVAPGIASIWRLAPVISKLKINDLMLDIDFFGDGKYSISDLAGAQQDDEPNNDDNATEGSAVFPFALYDFEMNNATIVFDDQPHDKRHVISDLYLHVPFTSSFSNLSKEYTQPTFKAVVNGDPLDIKGRILPFDKSLRTEFELGAVDIDLTQYWRYVPLETPLELVKGRFTSNISLIFERPDDHSVHLFLGGGGKLTDMALKAPKDDQILSLKELSFDMKKYSLGDNLLVLNHVTLDSPAFKVIRRTNNAINWSEYFPGTELEASGPKIKSQAKDEASLLLDVRQFVIKSGSLHWEDHAIKGGFKHTFANFNFTGTEISSSGDRPSRFEASVGKKGIIALKGIGTMAPLGAKATLSGKNVALTDFKPYLEEYLPLTMDSGTANFSVPIDGKILDDHLSLQVNNATLSLNTLALRKPDSKKASIGLEALRIAGAAFNLEEKTVNVAEVRLTRPATHFVRDAQGVDLIRLFAGEQPSTQTGKPPHTEPVKQPEGRKWAATVNAVRVEDAALTYKDATLKHPASLDFNGLKLDLDNVTTRKDESMTYSLTAKWGGRGTLAVTGKASLDPLTTDGRLKLNGLFLRPLDGHLAEFTELLFASGSASADVRYAVKGGDTPTVKLTGSTALNKVRLKDNRGDGEFASIEKLELASVYFTTNPYRLGIGDIQIIKPSVSIDYDEKGHSNIRRAFRIPEPPPAPKGGETKKQAKKAEKAPKPKKEESLFSKLDIGKIIMDGGHIRFRDASVKPTYYTEISDIHFGLIGVDQSPDARPKMNLRAKIGPTPVSLIGVFNPAITPPYSDLALSVSGMELVPLSPYTIEYLAYPIEKGRLYADVKFKTQNWDLDADNRFFVQQLHLGPKDKRPGAPDVPIKFGLSLLQDSNGDVELNLPIKGRLDDPDFQIGGIVFKAISGLMFKALASPFTLIGSLFGGGGNDDADFVTFEPGRHSLDTGAREKLETVTKALKERPKLKLNVDGVTDPVTDRSGLVSVIFENKLKQQKYDSLPRSKRAETSVNAMVVSPEEYGDILYEAYADEPDEEGIKSTTLFRTDRQPLDYMEKFIIDRITVTDDNLKDLARQRAASVKEYIINRDPKLTERIFLLDKPQSKKGKSGIPKHRADLGIK